MNKLRVPPTDEIKSNEFAFGIWLMSVYSNLGK